MEEGATNTSIAPPTLDYGKRQKVDDAYVKPRDIKGTWFYVALLVFVAAIVASIGMFMYLRILTSSIESQKHALDESYAQFDTGSLSNFIIEDARLRHATTLLQEHVATSELFLRLEDLTLRDVVYEKLQYKKESESGGMEVVFTGKTKEFDYVEAQIKKFESDDFFRMSEVISMALLEDEDKNVQFGVVTKFDPMLVSYTQSLQGGDARKERTYEEAKPAEDAVDAEAGTEPETASVGTSESGETVPNDTVTPERVF